VNTGVPAVPGFDRQWITSSTYWLVADRKLDVGQGRSVDRRGTDAVMVICGVPMYTPGTCTEAVGMVGADTSYSRGPELADCEIPPCVFSALTSM